MGDSAPPYEGRKPSTRPQCMPDLALQVRLEQLQQPCRFESQPLASDSSPRVLGVGIPGGASTPGGVAMATGVVMPGGAPVPGGVAMPSGVGMLSEVPMPGGH